MQPVAKLCVCAGKNGGHSLMSVRRKIFGNGEIRAAGSSIM